MEPISKINKSIGDENMFKAGSYYSVLDNNALVMLLAEYYGIKNIKSLQLHRAWIGDVYFVKDDKQSYVMKIYRSNAVHKNNAQNSAAVMDYLYQKGIMVPRIIKNIENLNTTTILAPEGEREVVVTSFVNGNLLVRSSSDEIYKRVGKQAAQMRLAMEDYPSSLRRIDETEIINRFMNVLYDYFSDKQVEISFFKKYGEILLQEIKELQFKYPQSIGFCHGDFHNGNMIEGVNHQITFFDFDACGVGHNMADIAVYCDKTNFFKLDKEKIQQTQQALGAFIEGYTTIYPLSQLEIDSMPLFVALRHYELNATIPINRAPIQGSDWLNDGWLNEQYVWLKQWYEMYHVK